MELERIRACLCDIQQVCVPPIRKLAFPLTVFSMHSSRCLASGGLSKSVSEKWPGCFSGSQAVANALAGPEVTKRHISTSLLTRRARDMEIGRNRDCCEMSVHPEDENHLKLQDYRSCNGLGLFLKPWPLGKTSL